MYTRCNLTCDQYNTYSLSTLLLSFKHNKLETLEHVVFPYLSLFPRFERRAGVFAVQVVLVEARGVVIGSAEGGEPWRVRSPLFDPLPVHTFHPHVFLHVTRAVLAAASAIR